MNVCFCFLLVSSVFREWRVEKMQKFVLEHLFLFLTAIARFVFFCSELKCSVFFFFLRGKAEGILKLQQNLFHFGFLF